jgi:O-antigen/teichoic acid export membrane protein
VTTDQHPRPRKPKFVLAVQVSIVIVWILLAVGVGMMAIAGTPPLALAVFVGGVIGLAAVFAILYRAWARYNPSGSWQVEGRESVVLCVILAVSIGLLFLYPALD